MEGQSSLRKAHLNLANNTYKSLTLKVAAATQELQTNTTKNELHSHSKGLFLSKYVMRSVPFSWESVNSVLLALYLKRNR